MQRRPSPTERTLSSQSPRVLGHGLIVLAFLCSIASGWTGLVHRWSFNEPAGTAPAGTIMLDSVSGASAVVRGGGAEFDGHALLLPGNSTGDQSESNISAYVDLPNGIISVHTNLTVEIWATPLASRNWQRLFDFGRTVQAGDGSGAPGEWDDGSAPGITQATNGFMLAVQRANDLNTQRFEALHAGEVSTLDSGLPTSVGVQYHYVCVFQNGVGAYPAGGRFTWYRNGTLVGATDVSYPLSGVEDVNNWLGRSQWSADSNSCLSYNEVRIYDTALSPTDVFASYQLGPEGGLRYRWSFDGLSGSVSNGAAFADTISGTPAIVRGVGATLNGSALTLPGTTTGNQSPSTVSAYVDLPNGILSSLENVTLEAWATPLSSKTWQRLLDFGSSSAGDGLGAVGEWTGTVAGAPGGTTASDQFALTLNVADNLSGQRLYGRLNYDQAGGLNLYVESALATTPGQQYHYVITFEKGVGTYASTGGRESWYRDGVLVASLDLPYLLSAINDVNNWLGRSQFSVDSIANVAFNEFRIYSYPFTPAEVLASRDNGPETVPTIPAPVTAADAVLLHRGQKALVDVLANDTGSKLPDTVSIATPPVAGTVSVTADGRVLYANTNLSAAADSFSYTVQGPGGLSAAATVSVTFADVLRLTNPALAMPTAPPPTFLQVIDALPGVTFNQPICLATVAGDSQRLFVCERLAKIYRIPDVAAAQPTKELFLDLQQTVAGRTPIETIENWSLGENGILGLAFHPDYTNNGYFFVAYTVRINNGSYYERISRFSVNPLDPAQADPSSELILLQQLDEGFNHNGGDLHFGPDGYLYYAAGDEENPNDFRLNSQVINKDFFAGIFRIDVDKRPGNLEPNPHAAVPTDSGVARFSVPVDNPFVHTSLGGSWDGTYNGLTNVSSGSDPNLATIRTEFWATGLRHVWRMSFDSLTGELWAGDVGQDTYEEVDLIVKGGNYGWVYREGAHNTGLRNPVPAGFSPIDPVYEYVHASVAGGDAQFKGNSVCGGVVYRGSRFPSLYGHYIWCDSVSGHIWGRDPDTGVVTRLTGVPGAYGGLVSMGVDPFNQDVLFCDYINGRILRLATGTLANSFPATLGDTGLFADLTDLSPSPGLLPYEPNLPFWSDHAIKRRWFTIPNGGLISWARDANWTYPTGMVWVKHFDLELERGNPATKRRIETRVLVKTDANVYGVSYRWNDAQTEATLVPDEGAEFNLDILDGGSPAVQKWQIPSRSSCLTCHTPQAGGALSFNTRQLNRAYSINGFAGNQIDVLHDGLFFGNAPDSAEVLPRHLRPDETGYPLEARVRSYIAVNCAYCHRADGTVAGATWDGRPELTLAETGLVNGSANNNGGNPLNKLVVPGDAAHSIVLNRIAVQNGFTRMPPLASSELDQVAIQLVANWITNQLPARQTYDEWRLAYFGSSNSPEGEPGFDADGDLQSNNGEFISGTDPWDANSYLKVAFSTDGTSATVTFNVPANRSAVVETTTDFESWVRWVAPGNDSIPRNPGEISITGPVSTPRQFFRVRLNES